jgi:hypothetical protein
MCSKHYCRWKKHGDTITVLLPGAPKGKPHKKSERCSGRAMHKRVVALYGPAKAHVCKHCAKQAQEWAYAHDAPDEELDERGRPFSCLYEFYLPLCCSCHRIFDDAPGRGGKRK